MFLDIIYKLFCYVLFLPINSTPFRRAQCDSLFVDRYKLSLESLEFGKRYISRRKSNWKTELPNRHCCQTTGWLRVGCRSDGGCNDRRHMLQDVQCIDGSFCGLKG